MAGGVPLAKGAVRQGRTCTSCVSKRGRAVVNWGTALKCQGCRLPKATCFGANVPLPAAAESKSKSGATPGGGSGNAPPWAGQPPSVQLAQAQRELADLKKQFKASGPASAGGPFGGAQAMEVDDGESAGAGDAAVLAEVHMCESGLCAMKDQTADWATAPREELRARLEKAKARLFASKPLHARTHAVANEAKQCAERLEKAEGNKRKAREALRRAVEEVERAEKVRADLLEQRAALQAELAQLQQQAHQAPPPRAAGQAMAQDVIGGLGITVGELETIVLQQLSAHSDEEQPMPAEDLASTAGAVREGAERDGQSQPAPEAAAPGGGSSTAVAERWQPEEESVEQLQQQLRKHDLELDAGASSLTRILLFPSAWFGAMSKSSIIAANVTAGGSLTPCVEGICERAEAVVVLVQEHRARGRDRLAALQMPCWTMGTRGFGRQQSRGPAARQAPLAGMAVLARSHITVTSPPFLESPVLLAARLVAAHVHWGVAGGFVAVSAYFHDGVEWKADNQRKAQVVEALTDAGCAGGDRAVSWAGRRQGGAAGVAARLRRRGVRVARSPPRAALPQRPPRPLALGRRLDRWGRWWIEPLLDADGAASDWLDHCVPCAEAAFAQPSAARQLAEAWCRRAWSRGARLRGAYARYRSGLTLSQRCVTDSMRRCEVYCLRSWLAAHAGLPSALGWARAAASQGHSGGEGSAAGEGVERRRGAGGDTVVVSFGLAIDLI
ncbi:unnamed protein product [Prorocentrum cordatum]|uniref:Uncharacterized protein n=1 Tax=Prorocentrum cordatum TaxID=2364126 RepID=A0ABN9X526_9DINO|nr:unnamed protein product [Polarella glacialis]